MGGGEPCWFLIISCGFLGSIKSVVKKKMHFCDWNRKEPNIPKRVGTLVWFFLIYYLPFFSYL
jgi:hypothetical protein